MLTTAKELVVGRLGPLSLTASNVSIRGAPIASPNSSNKLDNNGFYPEIESGYEEPLDNDKHLQNTINPRKPQYV